MAAKNRKGTGKGTGPLWKPLNQPLTNEVIEVLACHLKIRSFCRVFSKNMLLLDKHKTDEGIVGNVYDFLEGSDMPWVALEEIAPPLSISIISVSHNSMSLKMSRKIMQRQPGLMLLDMRLIQSLFPLR